MNFTERISTVCNIRIVSDVFSDNSDIRDKDAGEVSAVLIFRVGFNTPGNQQVGRNEVAWVKAPAYLISQTVAGRVDLSLMYRNFVSMCIREKINMNLQLVASREFSGVTLNCYQEWTS